MRPPRLSGRLPPLLGSPGALVAAWAAHGVDVDLTQSQPALVGLPTPTVHAALCGGSLGPYRPQAAGDLAARDFLGRALGAMGSPTRPDRLWLVASTSEAYGVLLKLLCNPGDSIVAEQPGYPLLPHIAELEGVACRPLPLRWRRGTAWALDLEAAEEGLAAGARAILLVCPHNPVGHCPSPRQARQLAALARRYEAAVIVDEVFRPWDGGRGRALERALMGAPLAFFLGGLSKWCGLPGCKLAWIRVVGRAAGAAEVAQGLDWIGDTYLSAAQAQQAALPRLWATAEQTRRRISRRLAAAAAALRGALAGSGAGWRLRSRGGWQAVVSLPPGLLAHDVAMAAARVGVRVHPGYFYDVAEPGPELLVLSLLTRPARLATGWRRLQAALAGGRRLPAAGSQR